MSDERGVLRVSRYGGYSVEFVRHYKASDETVWKTLTEPDRMIDWYAEAEMEPREGGKLTLRFANSGAIAYAMITEFVPLKVFQHVWITGRMTEPKQPMPMSLAERGYKCGDLNTAGSVIRFELSAGNDGGTKLNVVHYIPMNPHLIAGPLARNVAPTVSETPAPQMVMASWECLLELLGKAINKPGNRAMSMSGERTEEWPWHRHSEMTAQYAQLVGSLD
jgi:uncharacterized protein YndB with AHSA1/START domain